MNRKKYIFFDIDGTLTDDNPGGKILPSTIDTLDKLRANGHFVALATGRGHHLAEPFMKENGFTNMVSDGGNGITINGELLGIEPLDREACLALIEECSEKNLSYGVAIDNSPNLYSTTSIPKNLKMARGHMIMDSFADVENIYKIFIFANNADIQGLKHLDSLEYMSYHEGEIIIEPLEKFRGIEKVVDYMHGDLADVVVFGDGKNDLSMMKKAAMSIAMGNALEEIKEVATFVTKSNKEDGIQYACQYFGWID